MAAWGQEATKSKPTSFFRFEIPKRTLPNKRLFCAAAIGSNDRFLIHKRTFGEAAANDRFWPIPAVRGDRLLQVIKHRIAITSLLPHLGQCIRKATGN
jgi:hypothetical protein